MPIGNITQTMSTISSPPHRGVDVQSVFVNKQEDFQDHLAGITIDELNTLKDQLNTRIGEINSTATTMNGYATTASAGASTATTKAGEASTSASEALTSSNQANTFATNSSNSATKASQWADNNYNVAVEAGKYSAKHWSTEAQNATANKVDKVTSIDNAIVRFDGITGAVQNSNIIIDDVGNITFSGIGKVYSTIPTITNNFLMLTGIAGLHLMSNSFYQAGEYKYFTNNPAASFYESQGNFYWDTASAGTAGDAIPFNHKMTLDNNGVLLLNSPNGGFGYGVGTGGTVTQLTSKSTTVTLNKLNGTIYLSNGALLAGVAVGFQMNNSLVASSDIILLSLGGVYNILNYNVWASFGANGVFNIYIKNISDVTLAEDIIIKFIVIKGSNS